MIKKLAFSLFIFCAIFLRGQTTTIVYELIEKQSETSVLIMPELSSFLSINSYSLHFNKNNSIMNFDSVKLLSISPNHKGSILVHKSIIYKDFKKKIWVKSSSIYEKGKAYKKQFSDFDKKRNYKWKKTGRKKKILNFNCIEVTNNRDTAWYTKDLKINDGPKNGILGIAGLVLEYKDDLNSWEAVDIYYNTKVDLNLPSDLETLVDESKIKIPILNFTSLSNSGLIKLKSNSEVNKWYKFE